jgi:hypothetical protein
MTQRFIPIKSVIALLLLFQSASRADTPVPSELPRIILDEAFHNTPVTGRTISVSPDGDLQQAIDNADPGDEIVLSAGAKYTGNFTLKRKPNSTAWITIRSSRSAELPPHGMRVREPDLQFMAKIESPNVSPALSTESAAKRYHIIGLELTHSPSAAFSYGIVNLGGGETNPADIPSQIIVEQCAIHGYQRSLTKRGIALNSAYTSVIDSMIYDIHGESQDTQAICGWDGPGPYKIVNNYLEGAAENVMFGGATASITNMVPSDIEFRHNHVKKKLSWRPSDPSYDGSSWTIKNLFEVKNGRRILIDGNVFEHSWEAGQGGPAFVLTPRGEGGTQPWAAVQDITITNNLIHDVGEGMNILSQDDTSPSELTQRIVLANNLFDRIAKDSANDYSAFFLQASSGASDIQIVHNTVIQKGHALKVYGGGNLPRTNFRDNIVSHGSYGFWCEGGGINYPSAALCLSSSGFFNNVVVNVNNESLSHAFPASNFIAPNWTAVGFTDFSGGNFALSASSPYRNQGSDNKDIGVDTALLLSAINGVSDGSNEPGSSPPPTVVPSPLAPIAKLKASFSKRMLSVRWQKPRIRGKFTISIEWRSRTSSFARLATVPGAMNSKSMSFRSSRAQPTQVRARIIKADGAKSAYVTVLLKSH